MYCAVCGVASHMRPLSEWFFLPTVWPQPQRAQTIRPVAKRRVMFLEHTLLYIIDIWYKKLTDTTGRESSLSSQVKTTHLPHGSGKVMESQLVPTIDL